MVIRLMRYFLWMIGVAGVVVSGLAKDLAEYRPGDQVTEDIATPVPLMVVDPIATKALKDKEENRIPVIFRYNASALASVEAELRETFSLARSNFLFLMNSSFSHTRLSDDQVETPQFQRVMESFKRRNKSFPLTEEMAREWARGNVVLPEQIALSARVHQAMAGLIRHDNLTNAPKLGSLVLLVPVKSEEQTISLEDVKARGYNEPRTNVLTMSRARLALLETFSEEEMDMARFATRCLRENCFVESDLTRAARARHTDPLFVADNYQAGQIIARKGQLVDAKVMAALSQLQEKTAAGRLAAQVASEREKAEREQAAAAQIRQSNKWLVIGLVSAGGVLVLVLLTLALRRRRESAMLPASLSGGASVPLIGPTTETGDSQAAADSWQQRAVAAEQKAQRAHAAIRAGVLAQLKQKLVGGLLAQRGQMIEAQRSAAAELAELERRLNELHAPLQERLRVYEARIADLEKALAAKGEENRELIKAKIAMMRKQLATERSKNQLQFN
jgi:hypothetical protein